MGVRQRAFVCWVVVILAGGVRSHIPTTRFPSTSKVQGPTSARNASFATTSTYPTVASARNVTSPSKATSPKNVRSTNNVSSAGNSSTKFSTTASPDIFDPGHEHLSFVTVAEAKELRESFSSLSNVVREVERELRTNFQTLEHKMSLISTKLNTSDFASHRYSELNSSMMDLQLKIQPWIENIEELTLQMSSVEPFCSSLSSSVCGDECVCRDDSRLSEKFYCDCRHLPPRVDCQEFLEEGITINGLYRVLRSNASTLQVYCDHTTDGGGWTVFQRRLDGTQKFYKDWNSYRNGFGDLQHEFWLGNTHLHEMTNKHIEQDTEMRIELTDWEGERRFAKYSQFRVGNEKTNFRLHVAEYSGSAGDGGHGMLFHDGYQFSTFDRDNDESSDHCAINYFGGWWYERCHYVNLNGKYYDYGEMGAPGTGVHWFPFHGYTYSLRFVEMKIRRKLQRELIAD